MNPLAVFLILFSIACTGEKETDSSVTYSDKVIDHHCNDIHEIPINWIDSAKHKLHIWYARASHGSQLTTGGMSALKRYSIDYSEQYSFNTTGVGEALHLVELKADLEHENSTWVATTENYLASHPECNVVMWAWCDIDGLDVDQYLTDMEILISKYGPGGTMARNNPVYFVFMTAHTWPYNGDGMGKRVYDANQKIRKHCEDNNRWCYDFYDLECWDPDDNFFGDGTPERVYTGKNRLRWDCSYDLPGGGRGNWGIEWMLNNPNHELTKLAADSICTSCEHSDGEDNDDNSRLQCVLKGNAAWWLWARLAGWQSTSGNTF